MHNAFEELLALMKKNRQLSPWAKQLTLHSLSEEMIKEVREFEETLSTQDYEHMKDEMGDVFMDLIHLMLLCEEQGLFKAQEVIENTIEKLKRRKPFLMTGVVPTREEEHTVYRKDKEEEKKSKE